MFLTPWEKLPPQMQNDEVRPYYEILAHKKGTLFFKRVFDIIIASLTAAILSPVMLIAFFLVLFGSPGPVFYCQKRVGQSGKPFNIYKFRTMITNADKIGTQVTVGDNDPRITKVGHILRKTRVDEFPQLFSVIIGKMSLVGTRPEVQHYVDCYTPEMYATLLLPPGEVSEASIAYRNENSMLAGKSDPEKYYIDTILPDKMRLNLFYTKNISLLKDLIVLLKTLACIFK